MTKIELLDWNKTHPAGYKILVASKGALWDTKNSLNRVFFFLGINITLEERFLKFGDVEIKKQMFHSSKDSIIVDDVNII